MVIGPAESWGPLEHVLQHPGIISSVAFSPDRSQVASGCGKSVRIWNATTGVLERTLEGHWDGVLSVAFSHNGAHVVSGSEDKTIRIWHAATGEVDLVLEGHSSLLHSHLLGHASCLALVT